jgi:hypothetical protein
MADAAVHYGFTFRGPALCGASDGQRWTTIRYVTCEFCSNIIDLHLHDQVDQLLASRQLARIAAGEEPHPRG